jgi:hypothetical protein
MITITIITTTIITIITIMIMTITTTKGIGTTVTIGSTA